LTGRKRKRQQSNVRKVNEEAYRGGEKRVGKQRGRERGKPEYIDLERQRHKSPARQTGVNVTAE